MTFSREGLLTSKGVAEEILLTGGLFSELGSFFGTQGFA